MNISKRARILLGVPFLALMLFHLLLRFYLGVVAPHEYSRRGWNAETRNGHVVLTVVGEDSPLANVLREGDEILSFWSERPHATPLTTPDFWRVPEGTRYKLTIKRGGQIQDLALATRPLGVGSQSSVSAIFLNLTFLLFLVTGAAVFLLKPDDEQAWLLALMLTSFTALFPLNIYLLLPRWMVAVSHLAMLLSTIFLPVILRFFLIFPDRSPLLRRLPSLERWVYAPYLLFVLPLFALRSFFFAFDLRPSWRAPLLSVANRSVTPVAVLYILAGLIAMWMNYRAASPVARRRLRVVMAGSGAGFLNVFLMPFGEVLGLNQAFPRVWGWLDVGLIFTLPLIPLSFAYAIVRHQVIPVSLMLRRGVRYVLVSRGSIVLGGVTVGIIITILLSTIFIHLRPSPAVNGIVSAVVGILAYNLFRRWHSRRLAPIIDRRFFRQSYDTQQIIADLTESLRMTASLDQILELVATKIQVALQTGNVTIFLRDSASGDFLGAFSCGYDEAGGRARYRAQDFRIAGQADIVKRMSDNGRPLELDSAEFEDLFLAYGSAAPGSPAKTLPDMPHCGLTKESSSSMFLPLVGKDTTLGVILLGPRLADLPYSSEDERLLVSVAGPTALAIENAGLVERMITEARRRQELEVENEQRAKELEEARQLQLSMLPRAIPQLPHVEVAAYMKPATEVGGDYYDFHVTDDGALTVAVGDATGHGLKAGTVVAATKSLFNHLAGDSARPENLVEILRLSSRALKKMNFRGLFMAMMMATLRGNQLTFSSAGMPPMLIYRARNGEVEELTINGAPLGSLNGYPYRSLEVEVGADDVILMMSDGFPERFNRRGEMLGYETAKDLLRQCAAFSPQAIVEQYVRAGENWAEGRPQDDDVTFVVLKAR
jgi:serine phosphatase RsbU (regulator of sigma subunit)